MKYDKKKSVAPKVTVERIKKILDEVGLETKVWFCGGETGCNEKKPIYSCRVYIDNPYAGQNGKGTTAEYTLASGYAETIERLQNFCIFDTKFSIPDEKDIPVIDFINKKPNCVGYKFFNCLYDAVCKSNKKKSTEAEKITFLREYFDDGQSKGFKSVKFYGLKEKREVYLPYNFVTRSTNGMCAGNTREEALIQGLSEILERYVSQEILLHRYQCPVIPEEEYCKYDDIKSMICLYNELGFDVRVADASLGKSFPVTAVTLIDKKTHKYTVKAGAHPILPIAIERCLTEAAQGFRLTRESLLSDTTFNEISPTNDITKADSAVLKRLIHLTRYPFSSEFFLESSRKYIPDNRFKNNCNNNEMLSGLLEIIKKETSEIYIRDVSFLNFPAFHIIIPKMTLLRDEIVSFENTEKYYQKIADGNNFSNFVFSKNFLRAAYCIKKKDYQSALELLDFAIEDSRNIPESGRRFKEEELTFVKAVLKHKLYGYSEKKIKSVFNLFYEEEYVSKIYQKWFKECLSGLSPDKEEISVQKALRKIQDKLTAAYRNNMPKQELLKELFENL